MNFKKILGLAAVAALALMAFASTASATTLETNGVKQTSAIETRWSLGPGSSLTIKDTSEAFLNTCILGTEIGKDSTATTGTTVSGPISTLSFTSCTHEKVVVDAAGSLSVENISGTTNGTLRSSGASITVPATILGSVVTVTCQTNNTDIGTLKGVASGSATIEMAADLNCGSFAPSVHWFGRWVTTTSSGGAHAIGVTS